MIRTASTSKVTDIEAHTSGQAGFDSNGVRKAVIELLLEIHRTGRMSTIAEVLIALESLDSHAEGKPHSMKSLSERLGIPYTSVSRIVFSLTSDAAPGGLLRLEPDTKDRRRKHIELDLESFEKEGFDLDVLEQAMIDYYGSSVTRLRKDHTG